MDQSGNQACVHCELTFSIEQMISAVESISNNQFWFCKPCAAYNRTSFTGMIHYKFSGKNTAWFRAITDKPMNVADFRNYVAKKHEVVLDDFDVVCVASGVIYCDLIPMNSAVRFKQKIKTKA